VHSGYFDQGQISLTYSNTLVEEILRDHEDLKESDAKALLGQFNFKHETVFKKIAQLSGGERARIALLRLLMQPYNFLILDEPTNHMDTQSKKAIVSALNSYNGTVLIVSHDRQFLDDVVDTIFLIDTYAIRTYAGNYSMFKHQRLKEESDISGKNLGYLSKVGLKKYHVERSFTEWTTRTRYKRGEYVYIGDHNEHLYESAIKNGSIAPCRK
jgi:ATP-binding cassette subfamily F protein 3